MYDRNFPFSLGRVCIIIRTWPSENGKFMSDVNLSSHFCMQFIILNEIYIYIGDISQLKLIFF